MIKDRLFTLTGKDLLGIARDASLAVLLTACTNPGLSSIDTPGVTPSPIATSLNPNVISLPTIRPSQSPKPLSPEQQIIKEATQYAANKWFGLLTSTQTQEDGFISTQLRMKVVNPQVWKGSLDEKGDAGISPDNPLISTWTGTSINGAKFAGEIKFSNIRFSTQLTTTDLDRAKGYKWKATVSINFFRQMRAVSERLLNPLPSRTIVQEWLNKPMDLPPKFSELDAEKPALRLDIGIKEGVLEISPLILPDPGGSPLLKPFELPSSLLLTDSSPSSCNALRYDLACRTDYTTLK